MNPSTKNLPGFITVDEAVALINSDTRDNAVVNVQGMMASIKWLRKGKNFRIPLIRLIDKYPYTEEIGEKYVTPATDYERTMLEHAITSKFQEETGKDIDVERIGLKSISNVIDKDNVSGLAVAGESKTEYGADLNTSIVADKGTK